MRVHNNNMKFNLVIAYLSGSAALQNPYDPAVKCATDFLAKNPSLPSQWIYANGTFGGRETGSFVGWVDHSKSSLPNLNMMDGPQGVRDILNGAKLASRTSGPGASTYGMAWSPELAYYGGKLGANDWRAVGANVALTPGVNIHRVPINGRNWEYVSGEDAFLGTLGGSLTSGIQSEGLMATLKHFALNNQELNREGVVASIDEETLMESYLRAFQPSIDAGIGAVMCSYNQIQFDDHSFAYTCGSEKLLAGLLRGVMGFRGGLMTDWGAQMTNTSKGSSCTLTPESNCWGDDISQEPSDSAQDCCSKCLNTAGCTDFTWDSNPNPTSICYKKNACHNPIYGNSTTRGAVQGGGGSKVQRQFVTWEMKWGSDISVPVPPGVYSQIAQDALVGMLASGILQEQSIPSCTAAGVKVASNPPDISQLPAAYQKAMITGDLADFYSFLVAEAMVLLKNSMLPLTKPKRILLAGTALLNGGGSGDSAAFGYDAPNHQGEGLHNGGRTAQNLMASMIESYTGASVDWDFMVPGYTPSSYDVIVAFGAQFRSEAYLVNNQDGFYDLDQCDSSQNISLYGNCHFTGFLQNFQSARAKGTKVLSVATVGGPHYAGAYLPLVDAALTLMYPGQHFAQALAMVLSGQVSPGGKLTHTLPDLESDGLHIQSPVGRFNAGLKLDPSGSTKATLIPPAYLWDVATGKPSSTVQYDHGVAQYAEKNLVGYKYFEKYSMVPLFHFGFGLSYATYSLTPTFSQCGPSSCSISVQVSRSGVYANIASTVIQVYIGPSSVAKILHRVH